MNDGYSIRFLKPDSIEWYIEPIYQLLEYQGNEW
jgi:hypothetical protein